MGVINGTLQKRETPRNKQVQNVQVVEVQTWEGKDIQKSTEVPRKVTFQKISFPTKLVLKYVFLVISMCFCVVLDALGAATSACFGAHNLLLFPKLLLMRMLLLLARVRNTLLKKYG